MIIKTTPANNNKSNNSIYYIYFINSFNSLLNANSYFAYYQKLFLLRCEEKTVF